MSEERSIYGLQPVMEALRGRRRVEKIFVARAPGGATQRLREEASKHRVTIVDTSKEELTKRIGHTGHQGVVALLESTAAASRARAREDSPDEGDARGEASVESILARAKDRNEAPLVLVLDHVQDPQNLGALIRSAHALGAHGVVIPKDRAAQISPAVVRVSAGAALHLPIARVVNVKHALAELSEAGVWLAAAVLDGEPAHRACLDGPLAIVIGSESKGVSPSVASKCDLRISIPLPGGFDSLNASVAGGVLLYEAMRQRANLLT